jgi:pyruvate/2-oxoglutarate dehydrogenase complex dihydrolipoamide acyltransferase (E2) component
MKIEIKVPKLAGDKEECVLTHWYKNSGDEVKENEAIAEIMVEKIVMEIKSPATGRLKILIKENEEIIEGQVIGSVNTP